MAVFLEFPRVTSPVVGDDSAYVLLNLDLIASSQAHSAVSGLTRVTLADGTTLTVALSYADFKKRLAPLAPVFQDQKASEND